MSCPITMKDIASEANLSVGAVSKALAGHPHISEATRRRVEIISRQLDYKPRRRKRSTAATNGATDNAPWRRVGLVLVEAPWAKSDQSSRWLAMLTTAMNRHEVRLELGYIDRQDDDSCVKALEMQSRNLDGMLLFGCVKTNVLQAARQLGVPLVVMGEIDSAPSTLTAGVHQVSTNQLAMGRYAAQSLIDAGHKRIGFFCAPYPPGGWNDHWMAGYLLALIQAGLPDNPAIRPVLGAGHRDYVGNEAARYMASLDNQPTAYVVPAVRGAACFVMEMKRLGIEIRPEQIVMGGRCEEASIYGMAQYPMLSEDVAGLTRHAANLMAQLIDDENLPPMQVMIPFGTHNLPRKIAFAEIGGDSCT